MVQSTLLLAYYLRIGGTQCIKTNSEVNLCKILTNSCIKLWYSLYTRISVFFFMFSVIRNFRWRARWLSWSSNFLIFLCKSSYFVLRVPDLWDYTNINWNDNLKRVIINAWIVLLLKFSDMFLLHWSLKAVTLLWGFSFTAIYLCNTDLYNA